MKLAGVPKKKPGKLLGDAGEHYALSQFSFAGNYAAKMPDNWEAYDLAVETGKGLLRVSVKTRSQSASWGMSSWFNFDDRKVCDWIVFIFKPTEGLLRAWVIPYRKDPWFRDISFSKLKKDPLSRYEENWSLLKKPPVRANSS
jgi:hypothetical protein